MFRWAVICLIISLIAGSLGLTNISAFAKKLSIILFGLFFLGFLALLGFAYLGCSGRSKKGIFGSVPEIQVFTITRLNETESSRGHPTLPDRQAPSQPGMGLLMIGLGGIFMKDKTGNI